MGLEKPRVPEQTLPLEVRSQKKEERHRAGFLGPLIDSVQLPIRQGTVILQVNGLGCRAAKSFAQSHTT